MNLLRQAALIYKQTIVKFKNTEEFYFNIIQTWFPEHAHHGWHFFIFLKRSSFEL